MRQYSGRWSLSQLAQAISDQNWPGQPPQQVEYLVVGGGGSGGGSIGGGGGAGGLLAGFTGITIGSPITVTIGSGGAAKQSTSGASPGNIGLDSVFGNITAKGGGGGGSYLNTGVNDSSSGGSGGGGASLDGGVLPGAQGISGQGNQGGNGRSGTNPWCGGSGGGAGTIGISSSGYVAGSGGAGTASDISGTRTVYAGGGGGGGHATNGVGGAGGVGGGGRGAISGGATGGSGSTTADSGGINTGGGGGGGAFNTGVISGAGGSGVVIISYPDTYAAAKSTTGSPSITTSGSGSLLFNGTSNYLITSSTQIIPATGDFTIEAWIYPTSFSGNPAIWGQGSGGDSGRSQIYISAGGVPTFTNGNSFSLPATSSISLNTWTYFSFVRSGNTGTFYINSTSAGSGSLAGISIQNTVFTVGGTNPAWTAQYFTGYISNFRVSDVARTISTTPIEPFNASTANTKLLLSTVSGSAFSDSSTNGYTFTSSSSANWNALSPFATGGGFKRRVYIYNSSGSITF